MPSFTKTEENFIAHEVQLRVHDVRFTNIEKRFDRLENKLNFIAGIMLSSIVIPVALKYFNLL